MSGSTSGSGREGAGAGPSGDLTVQELRLLVAVHETGSFTSAGQALGLTQSAVSHAIRGAERKVGTVLFERGRTGASPTPGGRRALVHARQVLRQLDLLVIEARGASGGTVGGLLRIAAFRTAAAHLLPVALEQLTARHPGLSPQVLIVPELGRGTAGEVADGRADVAVSVLAEDEPVPAGLLARELFREPYLLVQPSSSADPDSLPLIDWAENCSSYTRDWWATQEKLPPATLTVADDGVVLTMVAQGLGMAVLPRLTLTVQPAGVVVTPLGEHPPTRRVVTVTTRATAHSTAVNELIRELRSAAM